MIYLTDTAIADLERYAGRPEAQLALLDAIERSLFGYSQRRKAPGYGENARTYIEGRFRVIFDHLGDEIWLRHILPITSQSAAHW